MKRLIKLTSIILIQAFIALDTVGAGQVLSRNPVRKECLSPNVVIDRMEFQTVFFGICRGENSEEAITGDIKSRADIRSKVKEVVKIVINRLKDEKDKYLIKSYLDGLREDLSNYQEIKITLAEAKVLIGIIKSQEDDWIREKAGLVVAQAVINNNPLIALLLEEMLTAVDTSLAERFVNVLFNIYKRPVKFELTLKQFRLLEDLIKATRSKLIASPLTEFLAKVLADNPFLLSRAVDAVVESKNSPEEATFCDALYKMLESKRPVKFGQSDIDRLVEIIAEIKNEAVKIKIIRILTKALANNRTLKLNLKQAEILIPVMENIKISMDNIGIFSAFFSEMFLNDNSLIEPLLKKIKDSPARIYFLSGLESGSKINPRLISLELLQKILEQVNADILGIVFTNSGSAPSLISYVMGTLLNSVESFKLKSPADFPKLQRKVTALEISRNEMPVKLTGETKKISVQGRTIIVEDGNEYYALKLMKEEENAELLYYEHQVMGWFNEKKAKGEIPLLNDYPQPVFINGKRVLRLNTSEFPAEILDELKKSAEEDGRYKINAKAGQFTFICYKIPHKEFFTYLNNPRVKKEKFMESSKVLMHDLAQLAKRGILDIALIDLFHNLDQLRRYSWMIDLISPVGGTVFPRSGAGRLHGVKRGVKYPNPREKGLADLAEMRTIEWIARNSGKIGFDNRDFKDKKLILASFLGDYLLSWTLLYADWLKNKGLLNENSWKDEKFMEEMITDMQEIFFCAYRNFPGDEKYLQRTAGYVNWRRLAQQTAYILGGAYKEGIANNNVPESLFPAKIDYGTSDEANDGWGYVDINLFPQRIPLGVQEYVVNIYFTKSRGWNVPEYIYRIKQDKTLLSEIEQDKNIPGKYKKEILEFIAQYRFGWRYDGRHEDLGPFNGPNPLTELIKALFLFSGFMMKEFSESNRQEQAATRMLKEEKENISAVLSDFNRSFELLEQAI